MLLWGFVAPFSGTALNKRRASFSRSVSRACATPDWGAGADHLLATAQSVSVSSSPHSKSHFSRRPRSSNRPFFEGWYLRAVLPDTSQSFAFMFSVEANSSGNVGTVQFVGPDDKPHIHQVQGDLSGFSASQEILQMCHWSRASRAQGRPRLCDLAFIDKQHSAGYHLSSSHCSGQIPTSDSEASAAQNLVWDVDFLPVLSWGERNQKARCTATWVSRFPLFEPGYQILMAHGIATRGRVRYGGKTYDLTGARMYAEKNWGASFPSKWWWTQANAFQNHPDLSVTAVGAKRMITAWEETVGMVAIHLNGQFFEFANCKLSDASTLPYASNEASTNTFRMQTGSSTMEWDVVWGRWTARAMSKSGYEAVLLASTNEKGVVVLGPTTTGLSPTVRDEMRGSISITLRAPDGSILLDDASCQTAQVEIGGGPWDSRERWKAQVGMLPQPLRGTLNLFNGQKVGTSA